MPVVPMREILDAAFVDRYGVAAINVVDDLTLEAVLAAATDLESPLIVQTSLKTVKSMGARQFMAIWRARTDEVPVPVTLHLDHCPDREWISICLREGWNSVLFDGSELDVAENTRQTIEVVAEADGYGAQVEGEIESVVGVEDGIGTEAGGEIHPVEVSGEFIAATGIYSFAPAIGTAHGLYKSEPKLTPGARHGDRRAPPDPAGAPRRHRAERGTVHRPHLARVREGQHLHGAEDRIRRGPSRVPRGEPRQARPALVARARPRRGQGDGRAAYPDLRVGRASLDLGADGRLTRVPALIFDCDGVLADTERDGHRPAFNETFAEAGLPVRWSEEEYGEKLTIGGGKERMASLLTDAFVREHGLPTDPDGQKELLADWHRRKTAIYKEMVRAGRLPGRPGIARIVREALDAGWALAVASTSAEESVRAVLEHVVGTDTAARFDVFAGDVVPAKKPDPGIYLLALEQMGVGRDEALVVEDSRNGLLAAVGAGLPLRRDRQRLHRAGGHERGGARGLEPRGSRRSGPGAGQPECRTARRAA